MLEPIIEILGALLNADMEEQEETLDTIISTIEGLLDAEIEDIESSPEYVVLERVTRDKIPALVNRLMRTTKDLDWSALEGKYMIKWEQFERLSHVPSIVPSLPQGARAEKIVLINEILSDHIRNPNTKDDFFAAIEVDAFVDGDAAYITYQSLKDTIFMERGELRLEMPIWIYPAYSARKKYHEHWTSYRGGHYKEYLKHSVDEEHDDVESQANHDEETGKLREWVKNNPKAVADMPSSYYGSKEKSAYEKYLRDQQHLEEEIARARLLDSVSWPIVPSQQPPRYTPVPGRYFREAIYVFKPVEAEHSKKYPLLHVVRSSLGNWKGVFDDADKRDIIGRLIPSEDEYYVLIDEHIYTGDANAVIKHVLVAKVAIPGTLLLEEMKKAKRFKAVKVDRVEVQI
jgi:hypothetical protein